MLVSDIIDEVKEVTGNCDQTYNFRIIFRAIQMLAKKGLFDPLIGYLDFTMDGSNLLALPMDVKGIVKLNINQNPSFSRSRLFEFTLNTEGSVEGDELGWSWADRGTVPIQNESGLPGTLKAEGSASDNGKTIRVIGYDGEGIKREETLTISSAPVEGEIEWHRIEDVIKAVTIDEVFLKRGDETIARYYPKEVQPQYRMIKLSKAVAACRMMYRKHVFKIEALTDIIPLHDEMAVVLACKAIRKRIEGAYDEANELESQAVKSIQEEQDSRANANALNQDSEIQTAIDANIHTVDGLIVADVYDAASAIFGPIGRGKLFDKISTAAETLENKAQWDSQIGNVDIWKPANCDAVTVHHGRGHGYFVLPRFVDAPLAVNVCSRPGMARNRWFEFHLNGMGEQDRSNCRTWDELGETVIINFLPLDPTTRKTIPHFLAAIPDNALDEDVEVKVYGWDANGRRIMEGGEDGFIVPCKVLRTHNPDVLPIARFDRIVKGKSKGNIRLVAFRYDTTNIACVGDSGYADPTTDAVETMIKEQEATDVVLLGDNNYPDGNESTIDEHLGIHWRKFIYPFLGDGDDAPLRTGETDATENHCWPCVGNHDQDDTSNPDELRPQLDYFTLPGNERYYNFRIGEVEIFVVNSEFGEPDGRTVGSIQYQWLVSQLAASTATWKVVCFHRHIRSSGTRHNNSISLDWDYPSLGVHAVISAHNHNYERIVEDGFPYFVVGTGGPELNGFDEIPAEGSEYRIETNGALFINANKSSLRFAFRDVNGNELDSYELTNDNQPDELLLGYYYPDEVEPKYRMIKVDRCNEARIRVRYRKRSKRVTSLYEPLHLRSRLALESQFNYLKLLGASPKEALAYEAIAVEKLTEEQTAKNPVAPGGLQFDESTMPGVTDNFT